GGAKHASISGVAPGKVAARTGARRSAAATRHRVRQSEKPAAQDNSSHSGRRGAMLVTIIGVLVIVIAVILVLAAVQPDSFTVERRVRIAAGADRIFPLI